MSWKNIKHLALPSCSYDIPICKLLSSVVRIAGLACRSCYCSWTSIEVALGVAASRVATALLPEQMETLRLAFSMGEDVFAGLRIWVPTCMAEGSANHSFDQPASSFALGGMGSSSAVLDHARRKESCHRNIGDSFRAVAFRNFRAISWKACLPLIAQNCFSSLLVKSLTSDRIRADRMLAKHGLWPWKGVLMCRRGLTGKERLYERGLLVHRNRRCLPILVCGDVSKCG